MRLVLVSVMAIAMGFPASAAEEGRFQFEKSADGYVRLDRQTGLIATCKGEGGQMVCRNAPDEIAAYDSALSELQDRVAKLEKEIEALKGVSPANPDAVLPSDEEFERTLGFMEKFFRRFMGIIGEIEKQEAPQTGPQKT